MKAVSEYFEDTFGFKSEGKGNEKNIFAKNDVRFTLITNRLLRVEWDKNKSFTDEPTQTVLKRDLGEVPFKLIEDGSAVIIVTTMTIFKYDTLAHNMVSISLKNGKSLDEYKSGNLKGTYRTLDMVNGAVEIGDGVISKNGAAFFDDSKSLILNENGTIGERQKTERDEYYFAYNHDYRACLKDFYEITGNVPLIPRYCLGNWWSRYKAYTQEEYLGLMDEFIDREIPITVATVDMDWHWVDVKKRFNSSEKKGVLPTMASNIFQGDGWTGYSWNTELFPDYKAFLNELHEKNLKVTLNLHPAQGVRFFEDMYDDFARKMNVDPKSKKRIHFDFTDPDYIDAYFNVIHYPYEKDGVNFWWIDWQQGTNSKIKNFDPLWALNHYHTLASKKDGKRPVILSRYAGIGSHRYPLGFSGDTVISWKSLDFQPYFTNTAANIGYTWWSHDIGGHHMGTKDDELYARWVEYGCFSPINRLHSTSNEFMGKEPWKHRKDCEDVATEYLRLRHRLIPYIYSMNYRTHKEGIALCEPMYYTYPESEIAYEVKNQYFFGSELMIAPITEKMSDKTYFAKTKVWLPKGRWTDIFTGYIYEGEKLLDMYRGIESIPVLAKEGAIIPLSDSYQNNDWSNPKNLTLRVFRGKGSFELFEDDGESLDYEKGGYAVTRFEVEEIGEDLIFKIHPASGDTSSLPPRRNYTLAFDDVASFESGTLTVGGKETELSFVSRKGKTNVTLKNIGVKSEVVLTFKNFVARENRSKKDLAVDIVTKFQMDPIQKNFKFAPMLSKLCDDGSVKGIFQMGVIKFDLAKFKRKGADVIPQVEECFRGPLTEIYNLK